MASVDLQDAYYTVAVQEDYRKYLRFIWRGIKYQYGALANGLSPAPGYFTKLIKPVLLIYEKKDFCRCHTSMILIHKAVHFKTVLKMSMQR